jgi:hypothetical protein
MVVASHLAFVKFAINVMRPHQFFMASVTGDDSSGRAQFEDQDSLHETDRTKAVGNRDRRPPLRESCQSILHL